MNIIKKVFALLLIIALLSPVVNMGGLDSFARDESKQANPFAQFDRLRDSYINGTKPEKATAASPMPGKDGEAYIIAFDDDAAFSDIYEAIYVYNFTPLAYSSERIFLVYLVNVGDFVAEYANIIDYAIPDVNIYGFFEEAVMSAPNYWELDAINADNALTSGGEGVVVAVLDSGINRSHELLANANISEGWNAVTGETGVYDDEIGHGTKITGIIVSTVSGIAKGASVLPVKITSDGRSILTSSLVSGIYYAADYGADVINMSFGGYDENKAESDAVEYAAGKGCILVAAAGNEGRDMGYAGKLSYPASYDSVISVASSGRDGRACAFSQYNSCIDIAAPGEELTVLAFSEGISTTVAENGTSYSTAFVSGAAALAVYNSPRKLDSISFKKLLEYSSSTERNDRLGWGVINLNSLMTSLSKPVVTGISDGRVYFEEAAAFFKNASAALDGEDYISGESIYSQGSHTLTVTDEYGSVTLSFIVDTVKLNYSIEKYGDYVIIKFSRGNAVVDGQPYESGSVIAGFGQHTFILTGPYGNTLSETFFISSEIPALFGVTDGGVYSNRVMITAIGDGYSIIDGEEFQGSIIVTSAGEHTIIRTDSTGTKFNAVSFTITDTGIEKLGASPGGNVLCSEKDGWAAFWDKNEGGIKIYSRDNLSRIYRYISTPGVLICVTLENGKLFAVCDNGYSVYDSALLVTNKNPLIYEYRSLYTVTGGTVGGGYVFLKDVNGTIYTYVQGLEEHTELDTANGETALFSSGAVTYAYSVYNPKTVYAFSGGLWSLKTPEAVPGDSGIFAFADTVFIGGMAYDASDFKLRYQINSYDNIVYCDENIFIAGKWIYSVLSGEPFGEYTDTVVSAFRDGNDMFLVYSDKSLEKVKPTGFCGAAPVNVVITGMNLVSRSYEYIVPLSSGGDIKDAVYDASSDSVAVLRNGDNRLYFLKTSDWSLKYTIYLKYVPSSIIDLGNGAAVLFSKVNKVYLTATKEYISFPARVSSVCMWEGRLFAVSGGRVCEYNRSNGTITYPFGEMEADGISCSNGRIYVSTIYDLTGYDIETLAPFAVCQAMYSGNVAASEDYVIAGNYIYDAHTLNYVAAVIGKVFDFRGNTLLTDTGMFSLSENMYITGYRSAPIQAVILPDYTVLLFGELSVTVIDSQGYDPTSSAVVTGISEGTVYYGGASIWFDRGTAYIDGKKIESGYTEITAGNHTLTVVTSWNIYTVIKFTVKYNPSSVIIQNGDIWLGVGQTATLRATINPAGAEGTVVYSTVSENINVTASGVVFAVSQGEGVVRAEISGTGIYTYCTVHVTDSHMICTNGDYIIDNDSSVLGGVAPGTEAEAFLSYFITDNCSYRVTTDNGDEVKEGYVATGMRIVRYDHKGMLTETLTISVKGDLDGDGRVSVNDADILYRYLLLNYDLEKWIFYAADCNANARITSVDLKELRTMLDYSVTGSDGGAELYVNIPLFGYTGSDFYITIQNDRMGNADSVAGAVNYDSSKLKVTKITAFGGEVFTSDKAGRLEYSILGIDLMGEKSKLLRIYFGIIDNAATGITYVDFTDTTICRSGLYGVLSQREAFEIKDTPSDTLTAISTNSSLKFDPQIFEYRTLIPDGDDYLNLTFDCPSGCYVYFNNQPIYGNAERRLTMIYINKKGEAVEYVFLVSHGEEYIPDHNSSLASLEAAGLVITPVFDPVITEYNAAANYGVQTQIIATPAAKNATVVISGPDILSVGTNIFVITCTAEDDTQTVYTLNITILSPGEESEASQDLSDESPDESDVFNSSAEESEEAGESSEIQSDESETHIVKPFSFTLKTAGYLLIAVGTLTALSAAVFMTIKRKKT
ncbi:MAG: S8 family serine peptidase [Eubacteriales bacterium]|nr:S8 family serine peptidase [Eubacteriales bacterium]